MSNVKFYLAYPNQIYMNLECQVPKWYVVYTKPKLERKVASNIEDLGIESYLPMCKVIRQWSDRRKKMIVPLFPNYVFVKVSEGMRGCLFSIKELVKFVSIERRPVVIREAEITKIKRVLETDTDVAHEEYWQQGMKVKIQHGQFAGLEGVILDTYNKARLVVKVDGLMRAFSVNISASYAEIMKESLETVGTGSNI